MALLSQQPGRPPVQIGQPQEVPLPYIAPPPPPPPQPTTGAYKIVHGYIGGGEYADLPSYMFPYKGIGGTPVMFSTSSTIGRNVETGGGFITPAGSGDYGEGQAIALASKYYPNIGQITSEAKARQVAQDIQYEREAEVRKSSYGGVVTPFMLAPIGTLAPHPQTAAEIQAKAQYVRSPTAQYSSLAGFQQIAGETSVYSSNLVARGAILGTTPEQRQAEKGLYEATGKTLVNISPAELNMLPPQISNQLIGAGLVQRITTTAPVPQVTTSDKLDFYIHPRFGVLVPSDQLKSSQQRMKETMGLDTSLTKGELYTRPVTEVTSQLAKPFHEFGKIREGSTSLFSYPVGTISESLSRIIEGSGQMLGGAEYLIRKPDVIPKTIVFGTIATVGGLAEGIQRDPIQTISDIVVTSKIAGFAGKGVSRVLETEISKPPTRPYLNIRMRDISEPTIPEPQGWIKWSGKSEMLADEYARGYLLPGRRAASQLIMERRPSMGKSIDIQPETTDIIEGTHVYSYFEKSFEEQQPYVGVSSKVLVRPAVVPLVYHSTLIKTLTESKAQSREKVGILSIVVPSSITKQASLTRTDSLYSTAVTTSLVTPQASRIVQEAVSEARSITAMRTITKPSFDFTPEEPRIFKLRSSFDQITKPKHRKKGKSRLRPFTEFAKIAKPSQILTRSRFGR